MSKIFLTLLLVTCITAIAYAQEEQAGEEPEEQEGGEQDSEMAEPECQPDNGACLDDDNCCSNKCSPRQLFGSCVASESQPEEPDTPPSE